MKNRSEQLSSVDYPWSQPSRDLNCFQNAVKALLETLQKRKSDETIDIPSIWVVNYGIDGDHTYLVWKGEVFNIGATSVPNSGFFVGPDLDLHQLHDRGQDRTVELLNELVLALTQQESGSHNLSSILYYVDLKRSDLLEIAQGAIQGF